MEVDKSIDFSIDKELAKKFHLALALNNENSQDVITRLMIQYVTESFSDASRSVTPNISKNTNYISNENNDFAKANRKIPIWARKPHQNNHRIIKAFFEIEDEMGFVTVNALTKRCTNHKDNPNTFTTDFKSNFAQMKTDLSNSHGKVFVVNNDVVEIWDEIKEVLMENKHFFTGDTDFRTSYNSMIKNHNRDSHSSSNAKITKEMVAIAYSYAKRVYSGELTRTEGKKEISNITGMNVGSAQDYIIAFLEMMEGKEFHRTISNYATTYYLENIKREYGEKAFQLALEATEKHIKYYNSLGYGQLKAKEDIVRGFREKM